MAGGGSCRVGGAADAGEHGQALMKGYEQMKANTRRRKAGVPLLVFTVISVSGVDSSAHLG